MIGSWHRSKMGRGLVGGIGERPLSGAPAPVAVAPARYASPARASRWWAVSSTARPESRRALRWASSLTLAASARLRVLSVYESTLPTSLAVGGWLATTSISDVLRRELQQELAQTVVALDPDIDASDKPALSLPTWRERTRPGMASRRRAGLISGGR